MLQARFLNNLFSQDPQLVVEWNDALIQHQMAFWGNLPKLDSILDNLDENYLVIKEATAN
jgi:hypothetical protein